MRTFSRLKNRSKRYFGDHQNQDLSSKKLPNLVEEPETSRETARSSDDFEVELNPNENLFLTYVARGNLLEAERIMQLGVDVNVKNSFHRDAIQIASRNGSVPMMALLLRNGASIASKGVDGDSLFHLASANGHVEALKWLHREGAPTEDKDINGQTVVHVAARRCELAVLRYLHASLNLDFDVRDKYGHTPIDVVPRRGLEAAEACRHYIMSISAVAAHGINASDQVDFGSLK